MPLNPVQDKFVQEAARPHMETLIRILHELDTFIADYDALQGTSDALPEDATVLDDGRVDAPALSGLNIKQLRDFSATMSADVSAVAKDVLISKMVRPLSMVLSI